LKKLPSLRAIGSSNIWVPPAPLIQEVNNSDSGTKGFYGTGCLGGIGGCHQALCLGIAWLRTGDARYVLLGEASHGTAEYYDWRRMISQRLIREKDFSFIAVVRDWPDCYRVNRYDKGYHDAGQSGQDVLSNFRRWPSWMWANEEVIALAEWLRDYNQYESHGNYVPTVLPRRLRRASILERNACLASAAILRHF
jgi:hypothetical protein